VQRGEGQENKTSTVICTGQATSIGGKREKGGSEGPGVLPEFGASNVDRLEWDARPIGGEGRCALLNDGDRGSNKDLKTIIRGQQKEENKS